MLYANLWNHLKVVCCFKRGRLFSFTPDPSQSSGKLRTCIEYPPAMMSMVAPVVSRRREECLAMEARVEIESVTVGLCPLKDEAIYTHYRLVPYLVRMVSNPSCAAVCMATRQSGVQSNALQRASLI